MLIFIVAPPLQIRASRLTPTAEPRRYARQGMQALARRAILKAQPAE
ncbi:hypothetical protein [Mesorhizobium sp. WSM3859]|nr:hypothetical protein [Mesorhizobium sp. WSM3859]